MQKTPHTCQIVLSGTGYWYSIFPVPESDLADFLHDDHTIFLRNRFRSYANDDLQRMALGHPSAMIQHCTLIDRPSAPSRISVTADGDTADYPLNQLQRCIDMVEMSGQLMLCMRSIALVQSRFALTTDAPFDISQLTLLSHPIHDAINAPDDRHPEFTATSLIYRSRWHKGDLTTHCERSAEYFITTPDPTTIDTRWYESWTM